MSIITLPRPTLFLEFFVREFTFYGKGTTRATLPEDAFFYTGKSKALTYRFFKLSSSIPRQSVIQLSSPIYLSFTNNGPVLSNAIKNNTFKDHLFTPNTNAVISIAKEYFFEGQWFRHENQLKSNKYSGEYPDFMYANARSITPYGFNISNVSENGTFWTEFPRPEVSLSLEVGKTLCFLCCRRQYEYYAMETMQPNLNLVMFIKNHGFHQKLHYIPEHEVNQYDSKSLCLEKFMLKDFRKNRLKYQLG